MADHGTALHLCRTNRTIGVFCGEIRHAATDGDIGLADLHQACQTCIDKFTLYNENITVTKRKIFLVHPLIQLKVVILIRELYNTAGIHISNIIGFTVADQLDATCFSGEVLHRPAVIGQGVFLCRHKIHTGADKAVGMGQHGGNHLCLYGAFRGILGGEGQKAFVDGNIGLADAEYRGYTGIDEFAIQHNHIPIPDGIEVLNNPLFQLQVVIRIVILDNRTGSLVADIVGLSVADQLHRAL